MCVCVCVYVCVLLTVNPHNDRVISVLFFLFSFSPLSLSTHISQEIFIRLSGDRMQQLFVCVCVCVCGSAEELLFAHMVTKKEMKDTRTGD